MRQDAAWILNELPIWIESLRRILRQSESCKIIFPQIFLYNESFKITVSEVSSAGWLNASLINWIKLNVTKMNLIIFVIARKIFL